MAPSSCSNSPLFQCNLNILYQDQINDEPMWLTTPIPPVGKQTILATPAIKDELK